MSPRKPRKPNIAVPEGQELVYGVVGQNEKRKFYDWYLRPKKEVIGPEGPVNFPDNWKPPEDRERPRFTTFAAEVAKAMDEKADSGPEGE